MDNTGDLAALREKTSGEFEILVGQVFRSQGYVVKVKRRELPDGADMDVSR